MTTTNEGGIMGTFGGNENIISLHPDLQKYV